jgi:hypothetical protein
MHGNPEIYKLAKPKGRPKGALNYVTREAREFALGIVRSDEYRASLVRRIANDTLAPQVETTLLAYAFGKPPERVEVAGDTSHLADLSDEQLAERAELIAALLRMKRDAANTDALAASGPETIQ